VTPGVRDFAVDKIDTLTRAVRPRHSLQRKMWGWMVLVACLPLGTSMLLFSNVIWPYFSDQHRDDGELLTHVLTSSLTGRVTTKWTRRQGELLDSLSTDARIAFVLVTNPEGRILHAGLFDSDQWNSYLSGQKKYVTEGRVDISQSMGLDSFKGGLLVRTAHVWNPPLNFGERADGVHVTNRKLEGAIVLGLRDPKISGVLRDFQITQVAIVLGAGVICLPLASWLMRRWMRPLDSLMKATRQVATDGTPKPVAVTTKDELGFLASAFNEMAAKVATHRQALIDANTSLEQKVKQRTNELITAGHHPPRARRDPEQVRRPFVGAGQ
jgi:HAMP domain-containing protein